MQTSSQSRTIGCIGKCTSNLTAAELDQITDNIHKTLSHPKGRKIFRKYLQRCSLQSSLECLELYEVCSEFLAKTLKQPLKDFHAESLSADVAMVREMVEDLDGVPQIDMALMKQFNKALVDQEREALLTVLEDTKDRLQDYLKNVHKNFKGYISEPCPLTRK